jgi:hypothetical protein
MEILSHEMKLTLSLVTPKETAMSEEAKTCPFCGGPARRITPMGLWDCETKNYGPAGVRYVCGKLYLNPPEYCPGRPVFYGDDAEEKALAAWNTRAVLKGLKP